jgi:hypothetical protein
MGHFCKIRQLYERNILESFALTCLSLSYPDCGDGLF